MRARAAEQLSAATAALVTQGNVEAEAEAARKKAEKEVRRCVLACLCGWGAGARMQACSGRPACAAPCPRCLLPLPLPALPSNLPRGAPTPSAPHHTSPHPQQKEEAERLAAEAAEKLRLEEEAEDPDVRAIRALLEAGRSSKTVAGAVAELAVKGPAQRMRVLLEALCCRAPKDAKLAPLLAEKKKLLKAAAPVRLHKPARLPARMPACLRRGRGGPCGWRPERPARRAAWRVRPSARAAGTHPRRPSQPRPSATRFNPPPHPVPRPPRLQDPAHQLALVVALEHLVGVRLAERAREAPLALKALYDEDCVPEPLILAWCVGTAAWCRGRGAWGGEGCVPEPLALAWGTSAGRPSCHPFTHPPTHPPPGNPAGRTRRTRARCSRCLPRRGRACARRCSRSLTGWSRTLRATLTRRTRVTTSTARPEQPRPAQLPAARSCCPQLQPAGLCRAPRAARLLMWQPERCTGALQLCAAAADAARRAPRRSPAAPTPHCS